MGKMTFKTESSPYALHRTTQHFYLAFMSICPNLSCHYQSCVRILSGFSIKQHAKSSINLKDRNSMAKCLILFKQFHMTAMEYFFHY